MGGKSTKERRRELCTAKSTKESLNNGCEVSPYCKKMYEKYYGTKSKKYDKYFK